MGKLKKKGEISSTQIVVYVVVIISFAVIVYFAYRAYTGGSISIIDQEICKQSIVERSSFNLGPLELSKNIPLKCKTKKICLTMSGKKCGQYPDIPEVNVIKRKISKEKDKALFEIKSILAGELYNCSDMLGWGKLDFMNHEFSDEDYCLICSRIVLDEEAREVLKGEGISYYEIYSYMQKIKTPNGKSYLESIYPGWKDAGESRIVFEMMKQETEDEELKELDFEDWKIYPGDVYEGYAIIAKMSPKGTWEKWAKIAGVGAGGVIAVAGVGMLFTGAGPIAAAIGVSAIKAVSIGSLAYGGFVYVYDHPNEDFQWVPPSVFPYDLNTLKGLKCSSFEFAP